MISSTSRLTVGTSSYLFGNMFAQKPHASNVTEWRLQSVEFVAIFRLYLWDTSLQPNYCFNFHEFLLNCNSL